MVVRTLDRMASGGIYDQVGGGFSRYSTDERWHVPHFEKMLYDNAQLAQLYTRAWLVTRRDRFRRIAAETLEYLLRELGQPEGGFSSSQDADSEGVEGKFYVWSWDELVDHVGEDAARAFGAIPEGNWEGTNVLSLPEGSEPEGVELDEARRLLFEARQRRTRPATDDKVLAGWNGMAIQALVEGGRAFGEPRFIEAAETCADFLLEHLRRADGRLLRSWRRETQGRPGFADDHALLASALLSLYETTGDERWFHETSGLASALVDLFHDHERGGFFQTGSDEDPLVIRPKDPYDNAVPSGNSTAADVLQRISLLTGNPEIEHVGVSAIRLVRDALGRAPTAFGAALCALDRYIGPGREVAIVGDPASPDTRSLLDEVLAKHFVPNVVVAVAPADVVPKGLTLLEGRPQVDGRPTAYVCERFACKLPVTRPEDLREQLEAVAR
jgi:hypothetical protein